MRKHNEAAYYAYQVFPWVELDKALTLEGLLNHRRTFKRREWGKVLSGSDEQLLDAVALLAPVSAANNAASDEDIIEFYRHMIDSGFFEQLVTTRHILPNCHILSAFLAGRKSQRGV